jgi:hypothetical protein
MPLILLLTILIAGSPTLSWANSLDKLAGEYKLAKGDKGCLAGVLSYIEVDGAKSIKLGARAIAEDFNVPTFQRNERGCTFSYNNKLLEDSLLSTVEQKCAKLPTTIRKTSIQKTAKGFFYSITVENLEGAVEKNISCTLVKLH